MTQPDEVLAASPKLKEKIPLIVGILCVLVGVLLFILLVSNRCAKCYATGRRGTGFAATLLLVAGIMLMLRYKRQRTSLQPQVIISEIPAEDMAKSPVALIPATLTHNRQPILNEIGNEPVPVESDSSDDLPDYYTVIHELRESYTGSADYESCSLPDYFSVVRNSKLYDGDEKSARELEELSSTEAQSIQDPAASEDGSFDTRLCNSLA